MLVKGILDEDFVNYKKPSMFISCHSCTFKCGYDNCQNHELSESPDIEIQIEDIVKRYIKNPITSAVVFSGLEPFDDIDNIIKFVTSLREKCNDDIVIYTGYTEDEIKKIFSEQYNKLKSMHNIVIKYGRYTYGAKPHMDNILGVQLYGENQYALKIS